MITFDWLLVFVYLVVVFILGFTRHMVIFKKLYEQFGNFDALHKPRFEFGILSMLAQGISFSIIYSVIVPSIGLLGFFLVSFLILMSFIAFAELGKHKVNNVPLFLLVQTIYCALQAGLMCVAFYYTT